MNETEYRVWWIPQIPGKPFHVAVKSVAEGERVCEILAGYDLFQLQENIKPDYCNMGGVEYFDTNDKEWYSVEFEEE